MWLTGHSVPVTNQFVFVFFLFLGMRLYLSFSCQFMTSDNVHIVQ